MKDEFENLERMFQNIQDARMDSMMFPAKITVKHGGQCQREMRFVGGSLSNGATRYHGVFVCDECDESVLIWIDAPPDIPYQLLYQEES